MSEEENENQHGGRRDGAGRPIGSTNRRTAELRKAIEAEGVDPALALVRIAKAAEDREEFPLAVEAYGRVLPFLHARPKPIEADPEALIALERALLKMKIEETAEAVRQEPGLAERLARAKRRRIAAEVVEIVDALTEAAEEAQAIADVVPAAGSSASVAPAAPLATAPPAPATPAAPVAPQPIPPRPEPREYGGDWSFPQRQAFVDDSSSFTNSPYADAPGGFLTDL